MIPAFYQGITDFIFLEHAIGKADIIFVPGSHHRELALEAAALYHEGWADVILPSGRFAKEKGSFDGEYETEWAYLKNILLSEGVPEEAVWKEDQATFTWENAIYSRKRTQEKGLAVRKALLVCQAFHARRAYMYYQEQFPDTQLMVIPVETEGITRDNWFTDPVRTDVVLGELIRCGQQFRCCLPVGAGRPLEDNAV